MTTREEDKRIQDLIARSQYYVTTKSTLQVTPRKRFPWQTPEGYVCHRCQKPGHFKKFCPTRDDPAYDPPKAPLEYRGVPKFILEESGMTMMEKQFEREMAPFLKTPTKPTVPKDLQCLFCNSIMHHAVIVTCCGSSYCEDCVLGLGPCSLFKCGVCRKTIQTLGNVHPNKMLRCFIQEWQCRKKQKRKRV